MKILFTRFPLESAKGGAETQTISLMKGLSDQGHAVAFLGSCPVLLEETAKLHLPHAKLEIGAPPVTKWGAVSFVWKKKRMQERLTAALEGFHQLDAMFMMSLSEKLLMTEGAARKGIKVFWMEHDRVGRWLTKNPWLPKLRELSRYVTTVCVSELSRKIFIDLGWDPDKVVAIPNGIDLEHFDVVQNPNLKSQISNLHLGCVARLSPEKGIDLLVKAVKDMPDVTLTVVGTGPQEEDLQSLATSYPHGPEGPLGLNGKLQATFLPHVDNLPSFYRSLDIFILPSRDNDPFGLVAAEAMALGIPVIVTDQCGIAGYLQDGVDAIIAEAGSQRALTQAISRLKDSETRKIIGTNGAMTAKKKFSVEAMISEYLRLL